MPRVRPALATSYVYVNPVLSVVFGAIIAGESACRRIETAMKNDSLILRYGTNPQQKPAHIFASSGDLPFRVLNGSPGYINFLDALNGWQLVRELKQALGLPSAASFKHVSPAGAAVAVPLTDMLAKAYFLEGIALSPLAAAYARARGADRVSSFGDFVALSDRVDTATAHLLRREVSDGVIAPDYEPEALAILQKKQKGKYIVVQIDPHYHPPELETREVFGVTFEQKRNDLVIDKHLLENCVTHNKNFSDAAQRDLLVALVALKYTQSNSVCLAYDGQVIGMGAGQQSRILCTRLAASKADLWYLRQHPVVLSLPFRADISRPERDNAIDQYLRDDLTTSEEKTLRQAFREQPVRLSNADKRDWLASSTDVSLGSDGFIPFRDNIERAVCSGVRFIAQPGGSLRDEDIIQVCDDYGVAMAFSGARLFHH